MEQEIRPYVAEPGKAAVSFHRSAIRKIGVISYQGSAVSEQEGQQAGFSDQLELKRQRLRMTVVGWLLNAESRLLRT